METTYLIDTNILVYAYNEDVEFHEEAILSLLDGETQRNNVMFLATTNYGEEISARFQRP